MVVGELVGSCFEEEAVVRCVIQVPDGTPQIVPVSCIWVL